MGIERSYYDDGNLRAEGELLDGVVPHGVHRQWHPNGVLAMETPYDHGIIDGTFKQWNDKGELIVQCEITKGTGVLRQWHPNLNGYGELPFVGGKMTGRQRTLFDDGEISGEVYWLEDRKVSKKRYLEACRKNPTLPRYEDDAPTRRNRPPKKQTAKSEEHHAAIPNELDGLAVKLLHGTRVHEALSWLEESREPSRSLGEATDQDESTRLVKKLYRLGAVGVHAVEIAGEATEDQNTGRVVIELPQDQERRSKLLKFCGKLARDMGFDPDTDVGQRFVLVMID
jgi:hypothetical protein